MFSLLRSVANVLITVLLAPGILAHEYGHVLGCRLWSVDVHTMPTLNPFGDDAYVEHEPVESFSADVTIAIGPLVGNTVLGLAAFSLAAASNYTLLTLPALWLGGCFALTAFPSRSDTSTLLETVRSLSVWTRPAGYLLAWPLRGFTAIPLAGGVAGYLWMVLLYGATRGMGL